MALAKLVLRRRIACWLFIHSDTLVGMDDNRANFKFRQTRQFGIDSVFITMKLEKDVRALIKQQRRTTHRHRRPVIAAHSVDRNNDCVFWNSRI